MTRARRSPDLTAWAIGIAGPGTIIAGAVVFCACLARLGGL